MSRSGSDGNRSMFAGSIFLAESAALERGPGGTDLDSLSARNDVAVAQLTAGRPLEAVEGFDLLLVDCRAALGDSHSTLLVEGNLAAACFQAGREENGIQLMASNLANRELVLGDEHPDTLTARDALATAHRLAGQLPDALALYSRVAAQRSRVLGPAHPDTLISRLGLGLARADTGDLLVAVNVVASALRDAEQAHGDRDLHTVTLRWCLGSLQAAVGNLEQSVEELGRALTDTEELLGRDHPDTNAIREELRQLTAPVDPVIPPPRAAGQDVAVAPWAPAPGEPVGGLYGGASGDPIGGLYGGAPAVRPPTGRSASSPTVDSSGPASG